MNEQELRRLVRQAIERHQQWAGSSPDSGQVLVGAPQLHASHRMFALPAGAGTDERCLIEPGVICNHCGYCKSYGH